MRQPLQQSCQAILSRYTLLEYIFRRIALRPLEEGPVAPAFSALKGGVALQVASWYRGVSQLHCRLLRCSGALSLPLDLRNVSSSPESRGFGADKGGHGLAQKTPNGARNVFRGRGTLWIDAGVDQNFQRDLGAIGPHEFQGTFVWTNPSVPCF